MHLPFFIYAISFLHNKITIDFYAQQRTENVRSSFITQKKNSSKIEVNVAPDCRIEQKLRVESQMFMHARTHTIHYVIVFIRIVQKNDTDTDFIIN